MRFRNSKSTNELNLGFFMEASTFAAQTKLMLRRVNTPAATALSEKANTLFLEIQKLREKPQNV